MSNPVEMAQARLDLRGEVCPFTFIRTKLQLEELEGGEVLEVILDDGEPIRSIPRSMKEEGHQIFRVEVLPEDSAYRLLIRKG